jgi:hypothetical protein
MSKFMEEEWIFLLKLYFIIHVFFFCFVNKIVFYYQHHSFNRKQFFFPGKNSKKPGWFEKERKGNSIFLRKKYYKTLFYEKHYFASKIHYDNESKLQLKI